MSSLKQHFLLDPDIVFLNHGSYGATPRPVLEAYQRWQLRLERQPVLFLGREFNRLMQVARGVLGEYLNADEDELVFIPNATHGVNFIAHSLRLQPGDEVPTTDHEYGACDYTWDYVCSKTGAQYVHRSTFVKHFQGGLKSYEQANVFLSVTDGHHDPVVSSLCWRRY